MNVNRDDRRGTSRAPAGPGVSPSPRRAGGRRRTILFRCVACGLSIALLEAASWIIISLANLYLWEPIHTTRRIFADQSAQIENLLHQSGHQLIEIHPQLGWRYAPNYRDDAQCLNSAALRGRREYLPEPPRGTLRVAAFGDSFTYGSEVDNDQAWPAIAERHDAGVEVLNFGVPGYGVDQAYLRYVEEGGRHSPHVVLIGFAPTDLVRTVNVYRRFFNNQENAVFKPRFQLDAGGRLLLLECPMRTRADYERALKEPRAVIACGKNDRFFHALVYHNPAYDYSATVRLVSAIAVRALDRIDRDRPYRGEVFNPESSAYRIQCLLFEKFAKAVRANGAVPLVMFLPGREDVYRSRNNAPKSYDALAGNLSCVGIDFLDAIKALSPQSEPDENRLFANRGHYSPAANTLIALWLLEELRTRSAGFAASNE